MKASINILQQLLFELAGVLPDGTYPLFELTRVVTLDANKAYIRKGD
ncbi:hypothetical protein [Sphingobacterium sp.]